MQTVNCKGQLIDLSIPKVMGILNVTPDSFYDGGKYKDEVAIANQVALMLSEGATFIDIGAYSSRPNAAHISETEELQRLLPIVDLIGKEFPEAIISVDTFRSKVAKEAVLHGAALINDISAGSIDDAMFEVVGQLGVPYVMMHMQGTPQNMQQNPMYTDVTKEVLFYFSEKIAKAKAHKIHDIIIDPGFGFGKTIAHNYELLKHLEIFKQLDFPVLAGLSRKSMIYKVLEHSAAEALNGTSVLHTIALAKGASILRVHDVKEAVECIKLTAQLN